MIRHTVSVRPDPGVRALCFPALAVGLFALCATLSCSAGAERTASQFPSSATVKAPHLDLQWRAQLVAQDFWDWEPLEYSQPVVHGNQILVGTSSGHLVATDITTGLRIWKADTGARIDATPKVAPNGTVLVGNDIGVMNAVEPGGHIRWTYETSGEIDGAAAVSGGKVFFRDSEEFLHAIDLETGERAWDYARDVPDYFTLKGGPEPLVTEGKVYTGFADGFLVALAADTGEVIWGRDLGHGEKKFTDVDNKPVYEQGTLYTASYAGGLYALDAETGSVKWRVELTGASQTILTGGRIYVTAASRHVACLDKNGQLLWRIRHEGSTPTKPTLFGDYLMYGSTDFGMYIVDRRNGYPLMHFDPKGGFSAPITQIGDMALMFSNRGYLYGFKVKRL